MTLVVHLMKDWYIDLISVERSSFPL